MNSATDLERLFKAGIAAYQQGDYGQAIHTLSQLRTCQSSSYRLKASMGLVRAYMGQKSWQQAKTLCQKIGSSSKPALQQWSKETLNKIEQRMSAADAVAHSGSGFQPIEDVLEENARTATVKKVDSGFQPLTPEKTPPAGRFSAIQATALANPKNSQFIESSIVPLAKGNTTNQATSIDRTVLKRGLAETVSEDVSMFHYAYLNGGDGDSEAIPQAAPQAIPASSESEDGFVWCYADRLDQGRKLGKIKRGQLWFMQISGALAFYFLCRFLIHRAVATTNGYLNFLDRILPFRMMSLPNSLRDVTLPLFIFMVVVMIASPWLWDGWLRLTSGREPLALSTLRTYSAEAATLINRYCRKQRWSLPTLHQLPTDIPLIFSYGLLPRNGRLVVSQGLLEQVKEDELAALIAYELSHWKSWYWPLLSAQMLIVQSILQAHWQLALWSNRQKPIIKGTVGVFSSLLYSIFWIVRLPCLGMARVRTYYADRTATEITGNPNGLARALAELSFGLASSIEQQGYTPILLEGLVPLLPVAADISRQKVYGHLPIVQLFAWDSQNPLRLWLSVLSSHPPLGDRLRLMMAYAQHWKLTPEIQFAAVSRKKRGMPAQTWRQLWQHGAPYVGCAIGLSVGLLLLSVGALAAEFKWSVLDWMDKDMGLFHFCWLLGVSVGTIMRMNRFFPDLSFSMKLSQDFAYWISEPDLLPASSLPAKLSGQLTGRPGVANWLGQDLMLHTSMGLVRLHFFSVLGPLGNSLNRQARPKTLYGQPVQVLGWFRRGHHAWVDVDKIRLTDGTLIQAGHPLHSLLLAAIALFSGLWLLMQNSPY